MKKGEIYEVKIERLDFPNKGVAYIENVPVIVKNTLPGQEVSIRITKKKKDRAEGRVLECIKSSEFECREKMCSFYPECGGCTYQSVPYEKQLELKLGMVRRLLAAEHRRDDLIKDMIPSPSETAYRNKMEYSFGDEIKDGPLTLGLHKKGSTYDILPTEDCILVNDDYNKIVRCVREFCSEKKLPYYHKMSHEGYLRHLLVRRSASDGDICIAIVTSSQMNFDFGELSEKLTAIKTEGRITGILHIVNDSMADVVKSDETKILYGRDHFYETILGLRFKITPFSFFQTNTKGAERLYKAAADMCPGLEDSVVFDLYCGTGTITQILASRAKKVIGVEIVPEAVEAAKENAAMNGIDNCEFICGDVLKVIDDITEKPDFLVLDPPRDGIHPKALPKLCAYGVENILYISCKPTSLARDLILFEEAGYSVVGGVCVDMFPQTANVETVCLLSQRKPDTTIEVNLDISELEVSSAETKATYEEIKSYVLKKFGLKVSNLYIAQVKRECGIVERINYNLPKTEGNRVPQCPEDKRKAIKDAFIHFQMI